ncbi:MAG: prepilin-type N-terminal cleavage/methylation domain-containing protein [Syntrophaceae bacterium]|nr:prepilin-type N-terminal cleavage/methylation domain-containing protein [Syntrophaceae bacterium]
MPPLHRGYTLIEILIVLTILGGLVAIASLIYSEYRIKASETVAQEDLRQAYTSAVNFFNDSPRSVLTRGDLDKYGFRSSPRTEIRVVDGRLDRLLLVARSTHPGSRVFMVEGPVSVLAGGKDPLGPVDGPGGSGHSSSSPGAPEGTQDKTVAGAWIQPLNKSGRDRCNEKAKTELIEAFGAAQKFFQADPGGSITKDILINFGYRPSGEVNLWVINGAQATLELSATFNIPGASNFKIDSAGAIREG